MRKFNKCSVALIVATAFGLAACSDGKDGSDGEDGTSPLPPVVEVTETTNVEMLGHTLEEGAVRFEFEVTNEKGLLVSGLEKVSAEVAELTDKGIARSRPDFEGTIAGGSANEETEGASLTMTEDGRYEFLAPMPAVNASTEGIIRIAVGGSEKIAKSAYIIVDKTEGLHTTSTATCHSCHVDYAASSLKHPSYTAINTDGETDLVAGCMMCHGNVVRDDGGYARNSMQKIGHINHQKFEKDFDAANCYTCHAEPITKVNTMQTCTDCHDAAGVGTTAVAMTYSGFSESDDVRLFHKKVAEKALVRDEHSSTISAPYMSTDAGYCTDIALFKGEEQLDLEALLADGTVSYLGAYLHGYDNGSIVGRAARTSTTTFDANGTASICFASLDATFPELMASSRITFNFGDDASYDGVTLHGYSDMMSGALYERRHSVTMDSCSTCHNNETNYHKNGSYADGGLGCVACHNNGQDRNSKGSAPGFGPMVHSMHWGVGSSAVTGEPNSATKLNAENCVACHAEGIDLNAVPNQYMLSKAFNGGQSGVASSPVTANCFACHDSDQALNHMKSNGGEINTPVDHTGDWYSQGTSESCATCHAEGRSYGIEKYHVFDRKE
ncbi:multiheme c-type cytochrome [Shewanella fidelis]|uniref:Outer membrane cytochrome MtrC/MtrF-like domain-containing protein n=1 Tax=Shewanella fidelis TaxID=173509 RepID=A0AAW8NT14_9GAMM|nr:cytochrome c3 family protein [Shewanella fidelis]MDR8525356.1 hypothetical protein [Shewanella fidelis]MDW4813607.1 hypothetical protein [Shewanella fidelis]MDW4817735.1 hypothetical protein [Shewanella fidelis]MDW4821802.1 hypothetical protein [Shewanella fidelis]MDW4825935.1 hypothetical protein [Shewanella fidelis]